MASEGEPHRLRWGDFSLDRVRGFSDCVFAVAITLVVATFRLPTDVNLDNVQLVDWMAERWPHYLAYLAGFLVIGYYWLSHHRLFELIVRVNNRIIWLNFLLLFFVVLMPFPTEVLGAYRQLEGSYRLFNGVAVLLGVMNFAAWWYATGNHRLVARTLDPKALRIYRLRALWLPIVFSLSFLLTALGPEDPLWARPALAASCWALLFVGRPLIHLVVGPMPPLEAEEEAEREDEVAEDLDIARRDRPSESVGVSRSRQLLDSIFRSSTSLGRLISFSDNVYAFAITLLGSHFHAPTPVALGGASSEHLSNFLDQLWVPDFASFVLSFLAIAIFWIIHHRYFVMIERQDGRLRVLNLVHLMAIAAIPFAADVLSTFADDEFPFVLFAAVLGLASTTLAVMFTYAFTRHRLIDPAIPDDDVRIRLLISWTSPVCFLGSVLVAVVYWPLAWVLWVVPVVALTYVKHEQIREQRGTPAAV